MGHETGMKLWRVIGVAAAAAVLLVGGGAVALMRAGQQALTTGPNGPETPGALGAPYNEVSIPSGGRRLDGFLVRAPSDCKDPPAVLIYHGFNETISYWAKTQRFLYKHCVSSLVFDPTGSGDSSRSASYGRVNQDAASAYVFARAIFSGSRLYVLGHSLGAAELLHAEPGFSPQPSGVIVANGFSSLRQFWAANGGAPILVSLIPDWWDNVEAIRKVRAPLLMVHSDIDKVVPLVEAQQVYQAAPTPKSFALVHGFPHNGLRRDPSMAWWSAPLAFMGSPGESSVKLPPPSSAVPSQPDSSLAEEISREAKVRNEAQGLAATAPAQPDAQPSFGPGAPAAPGLQPPGPPPPGLQPPGPRR